MKRSPDRRAESIVLALLGLTALCALAFCVLYFVNDNTQLLGLSLGLSLAFLAAAAVIAGHRLVPQDKREDKRPEHVDEEAADEVEELFEESGSALSRRRLLLRAGGLAGVSLGAATIVPVASCGPPVGDRITRTPWRRGRRLVDDKGVPLKAEDVEEGSFVTAFPEGADPRELGSPLVLVKLPPEELAPPAGREAWAPEGILAFSKICTHAGCAIGLYRYPKHEPTSKPPGLVCPCHYSTFDVRRGAKVIYGPAGRPLPQLPLRIEPDRVLVAEGELSDDIGPAWWGVRRT